MEMKRLVIELPAKALLHVVNAYCAQEGYSGDPADTEAKITFALGCIKADMLRRAKVFNIEDQTRLAILQVHQLADTTAEQLAPLVSLAVEDVA